MTGNCPINQEWIWRSSSWARRVKPRDSRENLEGPRLDVTDLAEMGVLADKGFKKIAKILDLLGPGN